MKLQHSDTSLLPQRSVNRSFTLTMLVLELNEMCTPCKRRKACQRIVKRIDICNFGRHYWAAVEDCPMVSPSGTSVCGVDECMEDKEGACSYRDGTSWRDCAKAVRRGAIPGRCPLEWGYPRAFQGHFPSATRPQRSETMPIRIMRHTPAESIVASQRCVCALPYPSYRTSC